MSKIKSTNTIIAAIAALTANITTAEAAVETARQNEQLEVGSTYPIEVGRTGSGDIREAVLLGVFEVDGKTVYKFQYGEGADTEVVKVSPVRVKIVDAEGNPVRSVAAAERALEVLHERIAKANEELAEAERRENFTEGEVYRIKVGRGETRRIVDGVFLGASFTEAGKRLAFLVGTGFDTEVFKIGTEHVEWEDGVEDADTNEAE